MPKKKAAAPAASTEQAPDQYHQKQCPKCNFWNANRAVTCQSCESPLPSKGKARKAKKGARVAKVKAEGVEVGNGRALELDGFLSFVGKVGKDAAKKLIDRLA